MVHKNESVISTRGLFNVYGKSLTEKWSRTGPELFSNKSNAVRITFFWNSGLLGFPSGRPMGKFNHNRWVSNKVNEGWQWGSYFSSKNKTHPALKDWDTLPKSHRRTPDYTNTDIMEWLKQINII